MERTGRPRDTHIDDAVLGAVADVLSQVGYARLTLEEVARRAGTTKPAIYRRWRTRQHLVVAALVRRLETEPAPALDSGCVVCDLAEGAGVFLAVCERVPPGVLGALLVDCGPDLRAELMARVFAPPRRAVGDMVDRAKARGDLRADLDTGLAVDLLASVVHFRAMFHNAPTDGAAVGSVIATLLRGAAADHTGLTRGKPGHHHVL
jgi:AcrR family transcriptional regulator